MIIAGQLNKGVMLDISTHAVKLEDTRITAYSMAGYGYTLASYETEERAEQVFLDLLEATEAGGKFFTMPVR